MKKTTLLSTILGGILATSLGVVSAQAQATRTWVSGVGDDANPCSRTAPCKTFPGAISKTAVGGEINCLDPGGFGAVTITKSITLDCHEVYGSILVAGTNAISIAFDSFADTFKTVRLRNLILNGVGGSSSPGLVGVNITGATNSANSRVVIEDMLIDGFTAGAARGINDTRVNGGKLFVSNTTIRDVGNNGINITPASGSTKIDVVLTNVRVFGATAAGLGTANGPKVVAVNSVFSGNGIGLDVEGTAEASVDNSTISSNTTGFLTVSSGTIRLSNSNVSFNGTGINGTVNSFSNNRFVSNGAGGTITPIGTTSNPTGQQ